MERGPQAFLSTYAPATAEVANVSNGLDSLPSAIGTVRASPGPAPSPSRNCRCAYCNHCRSVHRPLACRALDCRCLQFI